MPTDRAAMHDHAAESIDPFSGHLSLVYTDLVAPGSGGNDIVVMRAYSAPQDYDSFGNRVVDYPWSAVGIGWTMHFGRMVLSDGEVGCPVDIDTIMDNPVYEAPDGSRQMFFQQSNGTFLSKSYWRARCTNGDTWTLNPPDGSTIILDELGIEGATLYRYAAEREDRNGNKLTYTYDRTTGFPFISTVSATDGRDVSFTYEGTTRSSIRLTRVTGQGRTWTYNVEDTTGLPGHHHLESVGRPDSSKWEYRYNGVMSAGTRALNRVTHPSGGTIEFDYETVRFDSAHPEVQTTAISSKVADPLSGGSATWDFDYVPGTTFDRTTVSHPDGSTIYTHYGSQSASIGTAWRVGLLRSIEIRDGSSSLQTTTFSWGTAQISTEPYIRAPRLDIYDNSVLVPRMESREIDREGSFDTTWSNFDNYGNPGRQVETGPNGETRTTTLTYSTDATRWRVQGFVSSEAITGVGSTTRTFDSAGNVRSETRFGRTTSFTYTAAGDVATQTNAISKTTTYSDYYRGVARTTAYPEGIRVTRSVNVDGTVASVTDGRGKRTSYTYDDLGRVRTIDPPAGSTTTISYGAREIQTTRGVWSQSQALDGFGRGLTVRTEGITTTVRLDEFGRRVFVSYPGSTSGTSYSYDALDRLEQVRHADGATREYTYLSPNSVRVRDERSKPTTTALRSFGSPDEGYPMTVTAPEGQTTTWTRNDIGIANTVSQGGRTRTFGRNSSFDITSVADPEIGTVTFGRDALGRMSTRTTASRTTTFTYDDVNRLTRIDYPGTTADATYGYDKNGNLTSTGSGESTWTYEYNDNNVLESESLRLATANRTFAVRYDLNSNDVVTAMHYPSGQSISYSPDDFGRPTRAGRFATNVGWHPTGQMSGMTLGNSRRITYTFDSRMRPRTLRAGAGAGLVDLTYGYDASSNITSVDSAAAGIEDVTMTYDDLGRVATASGRWGTGSITYSSHNDIQTYRLGSLTQSYNYASNKLQSVTGGDRAFAFSYDGYGRVTNDGVFTFTWDDAGRLLTVPEAMQAYTYDGNNRRTKVTIDGAVRFHVHDRTGRLIGDYGAGEYDAREYIYIGRRVVAQTARRGL